MQRCPIHNVDYFIECRACAIGLPAPAKRDYEQELSNIYNALAESVLEMNDEDIEAEIREEGSDPETVANHVREVMRQACAEDCHFGDHDS
jgi:hypothetical protein